MTDNVVNLKRNPSGLLNFDDTAMKLAAALWAKGYGSDRIAVHLGAREDQVYNRIAEIKRLVPRDKKD